MEHILTLEIVTNDEFTSKDLIVSQIRQLLAPIEVIEYGYTEPAPPDGVITQES